MSAWVAVFIAAIGLGLPALFYLLMGDLRASVEKDRVSVAFGRLGLIRKHIPMEEIKEVKAVMYSPLREFGGWGIRIGTGGKTAWTVRGNRAVRMDLSNGRIFFLGSDRPERMVDWIRSAKRRKSE